MSENVKANELLIRALGAGVKGNTIHGTVGRYMEIAVVVLREKDPHLGAKNKLIKLFNEALTQANRLNLPIVGVATSLRDLIEGRGFVDSQIGSFILAYGRFEGKFGTTGSGTGQSMRSRFATENDYLEYVSEKGHKSKQPAPYAIRNWLAHIGSSNNNYSEAEVLDAYKLLIKWTGESS